MLTEEQIVAILAEASGGPIARMIPTFDHRTGKLHFPGQGKKVQRPRNEGGKRRAARKRQRQARKRTRRR